MYFEEGALFSLPDCPQISPFPRRILFKLQINSCRVSGGPSRRGKSGRGEDGQVLGGRLDDETVEEEFIRVDLFAICINLEKR